MGEEIKSGNGSRSATPTNEGTSKKRPRSPSENASVDNDSSSNAAQKKKKKTVETTPTTSTALSFAEEIAVASSEATVRLLKSSLQRLTDGIPKRELKLIVAEAKACEAALEEELQILRQGLELERTKKKTKTDNTTTENDTQESAKGDDDDDDDKKDSATSMLNEKETAALQTMIESEFTPTDTHWTLSALLGRLRHELTTPLPPGSQLPSHREKQGLTQLAQNVGMNSQSTYKKKGSRPQTPSTTSAVDASTADSGNASSGNNEATKLTNTQEQTSQSEASSQALSADASQFKRLESLPDHAEYTKDHAVPDKLLAVWKKLSTHRSSLVFRRPVNPKEAPGYTDRIRFPMDLSLIRKLILSKHIKTYEGILKQVHLIGHNCVKYNGRESDYALVTREFESVATEYIWNAVMKDTYGGARGRWSRNASPMPPSGSSSNLAASATAPAESSETPNPAAEAPAAADKPTPS